MQPRWTESPKALPRLAVLVLVIVALGLPINDLYVYGLLAVSTILVFTGRIATEPRCWLVAAALAFLVLAGHLLLPAPRIEEGHNVFLIGAPGSALEKDLPAAAFRAMAGRFDAAYPPERRCRSGEPLCWRPGGIPNRAFALAADGVLDRHAYSRRVTGIDFQDAIWLRLGFVNDLSLSFNGGNGDVGRLKRDRHSLAIFGRWRMTLPYFVMYRFPAAFSGSRLCWRGEVLWEGPNQQFEPLRNNEMACRTLDTDDVGRRIFGVSIGPDGDLAMSLIPPWSVTLRRAFEAAISAIAVIGILLLVRRRPGRMAFPLTILALASIIIVIVDVTFIGGYRPLDGGDDGLTYSGFARVMLQELTRGNIAGVLEGAEKVFNFTPGMRYFRMLEYLVFGDTFLGYLTVMLVLPFIVYAVAERFLGTDWALVFTILFVATPLGALFGSSYLHYITWSSRGFADPLAATVFLASLALIAGRAGAPFDRGIGPAFWGALMMAIALICRPNLAPAAAVLLGSVGLVALWTLQFAKLAALCFGFLPVLSTLWHNWYFGGLLVPFSTNQFASLNYVMPPAAYRDAVGELVRLNFAGEHVMRALRQFLGLLSGPSETWLTAPIHAVAFALVLRVAFSSRYEAMLRLTALAAIALSSIGFIYVVWPRYHFLMWLLMALVVAAWIKEEGVPLIGRYRPKWRERWTRSAPVARSRRAIAWLRPAG